MTKHILSKTLQLLSSTITLVLSAGMLIAEGNGNGQCSNASLKGSYGLHARGTVNGVGDFAAVGRLTFDGKGGFNRKTLR